MTSLPEQLSAARKTQLEAQLELLRSLSTQAISSAEQVISLNLNATRASVEQSSAAVKQLLEVRDPRDLLAFSTQTQQQFQQLMDYGRNLFSIAAGAQLDLQKTMPKLAAAQPAAAPSEQRPAPAAPSAASVAPAPAPSAAPAPVAVAAQAPAQAPAAAAAPQAAPSAQPAAARAAQPQASADDTEDAINAIAEAAQGARPKKVVVLQEEQPTFDLGAKEKPIASAAGQLAASQGVAEHPLASLPGNSGKIEIPKIAPVEAAPPPAPVSGTPMVEAKQAEQRAPKGSRKK